MASVLDPFRFIVIALSGWINQPQLLIIDYLREENRALREQLGGRQPKFNDDQRRRIAAKAKGLGDSVANTHWPLFDRVRRADYRNESLQMATLSG